MLTGIQHVRAFAGSNGVAIPLGQTMGFSLTDVGEGRVTIEMPVSPNLANTLGYLHGGAVSAITDAAMGLATLTLLDAHETVTTVEMKVNFLRPVFGGTVRALAKVKKQGRTLSLAECDVLDEQDRLVAHGVATLMTLRGDDAKGR